MAVITVIVNIIVITSIITFGKTIIIIVITIIITFGKTIIIIEFIR